MSSAAGAKKAQVTGGPLACSCQLRPRRNGDRVWRRDEATVTSSIETKCYEPYSLTAENRRGMHGNAASILDLQMRHGQGLAAQTASRNAPVRQSQRRPLSDDADHTDALEPEGGSLDSMQRVESRLDARVRRRANAAARLPPPLARSHAGEGNSPITLDGANRARRVESVAQGRRGQSDGLVECMVNLQAAERAPQPRLSTTPIRTPDVTSNFSLSLPSRLWASFSSDAWTTSLDAHLHMQYSHGCRVGLSTFARRKK